MTSKPTVRAFNPLRLWNTSFRYHLLSTDGAAPSSFSPFLERLPSWSNNDRLGKQARWSRGRLTAAVLLSLFSLIILFRLGKRHANDIVPMGEDRPYHWMHFHSLDTYFNGVRTLVPPTDYTPGNRFNKSIPPESWHQQGQFPPSPEPPLDPVPFDPYPEYESQQYLSAYLPVEKCFVDMEGGHAAPDIYAYPGIPADMPMPSYGSYEALGLESNVCFERFGRLAPYGYGFDERESGYEPVAATERDGSDKVFEQIHRINYSSVDWGQAQRQCFEKNRARFQKTQNPGMKHVPRQALVLRTWTGYEYGIHQILTLRAMISELNLKSGGEYEVHFLCHVKDNNIPIWADDAVYRQTLEENVPREFWNMTTLWSEQQMKLYYPGPFDPNFSDMVADTAHTVYRSPHFALQWFAQEHPEYDFFWNWEMDLRYTGHFYEFLSRIHSWSSQQPRKGMWERGSRFYLPEIHGSYHNFTEFVQAETEQHDVPENNVEQNGPLPVWGPVYFPNSASLPPPNSSIPPTSYENDAFTWGVNEAADLLTFNPLFQPATTNWVFRNDVSGYPLDLPEPPRRAAIVTAARLSRALLQSMHEEVFRLRHSMFPEMFPASVALHHGYKALYVPHPVYFANDWNTDEMNQVFNYPKEVWESPFGWGEHNLFGATFYYNSRFAGELWRRWLGLRDNDGGGKQAEEEETGRLCLRSILFHPIKSE